MLNKISKYLILFLLIFCCTISFAYYHSIDNVAFKGYDKEGAFVEDPAYIGDVTGYLITLLPAMVVSEPFRLCFNMDETADDVGYYMIEGTTKAFGCIYGGPSYGFKKAFWDFPCWVFSGGKNDSETKQIPAIESKRLPASAVDHTDSDSALPKWLDKDLSKPSSGNGKN